MTTMTPVCAYCKHFHRVIRDREECDAFPEGIPRVILSGRSDHQKPVAGDHGILFSPVEGFEHMVRGKRA